ncbi:MAG: YihY/virulence factor BrkB family protein [Deltaproteobacteria bacterium]
MSAKAPAPPSKKHFFNPKAVWDFLVETFTQWNKDNAMTLGAALAFYTTFSMAPLLIVVIAIFGFILGEQTVQIEIIKRVQEMIGAQGANAVKTMIHAAYRPGSGFWATIIGVVVILLGSTSALVMLKQALNIVWGAKTNPNAPIWNLVKERLLSFVMILLIGFLLMLSLLLSVALSIVTGFFRHVLPLTPFIMQMADVVISILLITLLFALVYKVLPDVEIAWTDVWIGSAITAILFTLGKLLFGMYLGRSSITSAYGAASSLAIILMWVYYSSQVFFIGAEITQVYANRYGSHVRPVWNLESPGLGDQPHPDHPAGAETASPSRVSPASCPEEGEKE